LGSPYPCGSISNQLPVAKRESKIQNPKPKIKYAPWTKGRYEVAPGLRPLGTDFGNGEWDQKIFQLDETAPRLIEAKIQTLQERETKYHQEHDLKKEVKAAAEALIRHHLKIEEPQALDELALLVPEDIAIVATDGQKDWLAYAHLCAPSHWSPEEKIGKSFAAVHQPIPGFERTAAVADRMVQTMTQSGPFVRFVWGMESDDRPNHHPEAPRGIDQAEWWGRQFQERQRFFVRVERQCLLPMPGVNASLFTIRLSWWTMEEILANEPLKTPLVKALQGMSEAERQYKGIDTQFQALMNLINENG